MSPEVIPCPMLAFRDIDYTWRKTQFRRGSSWFVVVHVVVQCRGSNVMVQCHGLNQFVVVRGGSIVVVRGGSWWFIVVRGGSW